MEKDPYAGLTWEDLEDWAGTTIVSRGRTYQRNSSVSDLGITPEGALIAYVLGSARYVTQVVIQDGDLTSECTCPYWTNCKHAVAVVLEYLMCLKNDVAVPEISQTDARLDMLQETETTGEEYWNPELGMWTDVEEQLEGRTTAEHRLPFSLPEKTDQSATHRTARRTHQSLSRCTRISGGSPKCSQW